jgi:hypothetical protein
VAGEGAALTTADRYHEHGCVRAPSVFDALEVAERRAGIEGILDGVATGARA